MDARQGTLENPFGMDEECRNCPALCETRTQVVHGYGDVGADFLVVGEAPGERADRTGVPLGGDGERLLEILGRLGFTDAAPDSRRPDLENVFLTSLARCRHPERPPTDEEVRNCEPYLTSEIRMINPEILLPVGQRVLEALALEYTTSSPDEFDVERDHATTVRGRGFELVPVLPFGEQTDAETEAVVECLSDVLGRDYRQTKGRRGR